MTVLSMLVVCSQRHRDGSASTHAEGLVVIDAHGIFEVPWAHPPGHVGDVHRAISVHSWVQNSPSEQPICK